MNRIVENPTIRRASPNDLSRIMRIFEDSIAAMQMAGIDQWDNLYPSEDHINDDVSLKAGVVAVAGEDTAAYVATDECQPSEWRAARWGLRGRFLCVHRLVVAPTYHRRGIASSLMEHIELSGRTSGFEVIRLDAFSLNPAAVNLYRSRDYSEAGTVTSRKGPFVCFEKALGR